VKLVVPNSDATLIVPSCALAISEQI
jgi:hypothetical protein